MQRKLRYSNSYVDPTDPTAYVTIPNPYINIAKDLSLINSKNEEITTRDGHVFGYLCKVTVLTGASGGVTTLLAPNSWKMRNSFRKFHAYRDIMFENVGVEGDEVGRYGHTIRPLLDGVQTGDITDTLVPGRIDSAGNFYFYNGGDWSYTELAVTPAYEEGVPVTSEDQWADGFLLQITEENVAQGAVPGASSGYYKRVGMIHSYNIDRMEVVTADANTTITGPANPLAQLISSGNQAVGEVIEIATELELEKPPYDLADNGDSIYTCISNVNSTPTTGGTFSFMCFVPAGLMQMRFTLDSAPSSIEIEVMDKVLCKDM